MSAYPTRALVLAAGLGSRIRSVAGDLPKPLIAFAGRPILAHNLRWLAAGGVREVVINLHYGADQIRAAIGDGAAFGLAVDYVFEPELLGTAGALGNVWRHAGDGVSNTWVVYGDNILNCDLGAVWRAHCDRAGEATVVLFDPARHANTGIAGGRVAVDQTGLVSGFVEGPGEGLVNAGLYVVEPSVSDLIPADRLIDFGRDVFPAMLARGRRLAAHIMEPEGVCLGLDTPEAYAAGQALLAAGRVRLT